MAKINLQELEDAKRSVDLNSLDNDSRQIDLSQLEDGPSNNTNNTTFEAGEAAKQFGIGLTNEALMGIPLYALKKAKGKEAVDALKSNNIVERVARGTGTTVGLAVGLPKAVFGLGIKGAQFGMKAIEGTNLAKKAMAYTRLGFGLDNAKKIAKFGDAATKAAVGTGAYELAHAPEDNFKEKIITVPTATLFGGALGLAGEAVSPYAEKLLNKFGLKNKEYIGGTPELDKLNTVLNSSEVAKESTNLKVKNFGNVVETTLVDDRAPFKHVQEAAEQITGKPIAFGDKPYEAARLLSGIGGKIINKFNALSSILNPQRRYIKNIEQIFTAERMLERAQKGFKNPGGIDEAQATKILADIESSVGTDRFNQLRSTTNTIRRQYTDNIINELAEAGIMSKDGAAKILSENQSYAHFDVIKDIESHMNSLQTGKKLNVHEPGFLKAVEGTTSDIRSPLDALVKDTITSTNLIEKNKVLQKLTRLSDGSPAMAEFIQPLRQSENVLESIGIKTDLKELLPLRNRINRMVGVRDKRLRRLITNIDQLEQEGLNVSLKEKKEIFARDFNEERYLKTRPVNVKAINPKTGKYYKTKNATIEGATVKSSTEVFHSVPEYASRYDTKKFIENFIELPNSEIQMIKSKIGKRDKKLSKLIDEIVSMRDEFKGIKSSIFNSRERLREIADKDLPAGMERISVFRNGVKESYAVSKEIGDVVKGLNNETMDLMTKFASFQSRALRAGATQLNLAFVLPNMIRDFQSAKLMTQGKFGVLDWVKGAAEALKKGDVYKQFLESGGSFSGFQSRYGTNIPAGIKEVLPSISKTVGNALNPFHWLSSIAEISEQSTRLGVFSRSLKQGMPLEQAGYTARNATVDFSKMGTKMKIANTWVPFINARLQGTLNSVEAFKKNPKAFALTATGLVTLPLTMTYAWNQTEYPDVWKDIRQFEKDNNFIFIYGREKDENGKWLNVAKIPKGDIGRILGNPIEAFYEYAMGNDPSFINVLKNTIADLSPVGAGGSPAALSSILPPAIKASVETNTNKNLFTGLDIVPYRLQRASARRQYTEETSPVAIAAGQIIGVSPMKIENMVGTVFGGLGKQILTPANLSKSITRRFTGAYGDQQSQEDFNILDDISKGTEDKKANDYDMLRRSLVEFNSIDNPALKMKYLKEKFNSDTKMMSKFVDLLEAKSKGEQPIHRALRGRPIKDRIKFIKEKSMTFDTDEEKIIFLKEMLSNKIIDLNHLKDNQ